MKMYTKDPRDPAPAITDVAAVPGACEARWQRSGFWVWFTEPAPMTQAPRSAHRATVRSVRSGHHSWKVAALAERRRVRDRCRRHTRLIPVLRHRARRRVGHPDRVAEVRRRSAEHPDVTIHRAAVQQLDLLGEPLGSMTIVVNGERVAGTVRTPDGSYRIRSVGNGVYALSEARPIVVKCEVDEPHAPQGMTTSRPGWQQSPSAG